VSLISHFNHDLLPSLRAYESLVVIHVKGLFRCKYHSLRCRVRMAISI